MQSFRRFLLETFGIDNVYSAVAATDVKLQRSGEKEPFAEITDHRGHTVLRVGQTLTQGPVFKIK